MRKTSKNFVFSAHRLQSVNQDVVLKMFSNLIQLGSFCRGSVVTPGILHRQGQIHHLEGVFWFATPQNRKTLLKIIFEGVPDKTAFEWVLSNPQMSNYYAHIDTPGKRAVVFGTRPRQRQRQRHK